jgi:hypothetical protein
MPGAAMASRNLAARREQHQNETFFAVDFSDDPK